MQLIDNIKHLTNQLIDVKKVLWFHTYNVWYVDHLFCKTMNNVYTLVQYKPDQGQFRFWNNNFRLIQTPVPESELVNLEVMELDIKFRSESVLVESVYMKATEVKLPTGIDFMIPLFYFGLLMWNTWLYI